MDRNSSYQMNPTEGGEYKVVDSEPAVDAEGVIHLAVAFLFRERERERERSPEVLKTYSKTDPYQQSYLLCVERRVQ